MNARSDQSNEDFWVFAYGSLMWRPGFGFLERRNARLDRGGNCRGIAYRVAPAKRSETVAYLRAREQVTLVYREAWRRVWLDDDPQESVHALCYMVDRGHRQYAGRLSLAERLHYARQGHGRSGACRDYVLAAVKELQTLGIRDVDLQVLAEQLKGVHESATR